MICMHATFKLPPNGKRPCGMVVKRNWPGELMGKLDGVLWSDSYPARAYSGRDNREMQWQESGVQLGQAQPEQAERNY